MPIKHFDPKNLSTLVYEEYPRSKKTIYYLRGSQARNFSKITLVVKTNYTANQISDTLRKQIDANDNLLVIRVRKDYAGWLPKEAWEWLDNADYN